MSSSTPFFNDFPDCSRTGQHIRNVCGRCLFRCILRAKPGDEAKIPSLYCLLARAYLLVRSIPFHLDKAHAALQKAAPSGPHGVVALLNAAVWYSKGDINHAFELYFSLLKSNITTKELWWNVASVLEISGMQNLDSAFKAYTNNAALDPSPIRLAVFRINALLGMKDKAAKVFSAALAIRRAAAAIRLAAGWEERSTTGPELSFDDFQQKALDKLIPAGVFIPSIRGIIHNNKQAFESRPTVYCTAPRRDNPLLINPADQAIINSELDNHGEDRVVTG